MHRTILLIICGLPLVACQSAPPEPLDPVALTRAVEGRSADEASLRQALALIDQPDLRPVLDLNRLDQADHGDFWQASALCHGPALRAARRELEAVLALRESAGLPERIALGGRFLDLAELDRDIEVSASIDILGLFGLGPSGAARALADAEVRRAAAGLEEAAWRTRFEVEQARLALAVQVGLVAELRAQALEVASDLERFAALDRLGRLAPAALARARAHARLLDQGIADEARALVDRRAALAEVVGIPLDHPRLEAVGVATLDHLLGGDRGPAIEPLALLARHPELRRRRLDYALSEARLRRAVAAQWPALRLGPKAKISPDDFITGGLVDLSLPWPGSTSGPIEAGRIDRARARERLEEALLSVLTRTRAARAREEIARLAFLDEATPAQALAATTWRGMRARFRVDESSWDRWTDALNLRTTAIRSFWRAREAAARARVELARELALSESDDE